MTTLKEYVWIDTKTGDLYVVSNSDHNSFGTWFWPAHGINYLGEL